ncbi:MAG: hypothetical protein M3Z36_09200, partial [Acidobacteriota bacterium]|nr:hypothetical protein [Acidobacteriota bacterium]
MSLPDFPLCHDEMVEEEVLGKAYDGRLMRRLLSYMRPYGKLIALSSVCLVVYSLLQVCGPLLTKLAIDKYLAPNARPAASPLDGFLSAD